MRSIAVFHLPYSHFSAKVKIVLLEKGIEASLQNINELKENAYSQINPAGKVPFLTAGELKLGESEVIVEWLDEQFPDPKLMPAAPDDRARSRLVSRYHDLYIGPNLSVLFGQLGAEERDAQVVAESSDKIVTHLSEVELLLNKGPYFNGDQFGLADACYALSLWYTYWLFDQLAISEKLEPFVCIEAWKTQLEQRGSVKAVLTECKQALGLNESEKAA